MNEPLVISSHLPDIVDQYIATRAQRLALEAQASQVEELEGVLKKTIITKLLEGDMKAIGAKNGLVKLQETVEPVPENWQEIWKHIQETGRFEYLHRRLTTTAIREHWEAGETIPGVGKKTVYNLSVSGLK